MSKPNPRTVELVKSGEDERGRPAKLEMPPPIPDTPENVAKAIMRGPPKKTWRYLGNKAR